MTDQSDRELYNPHKYNRPVTLQQGRPLITPPDPSLQHRPVPHPKPDLERLRIQRQARLGGVAVQRVQDRPVRRILCGHHLKGADEPQEGRIQLAVGQMRAHAHAAARAVAVVRRAGRSVADV